MPELIRIRPKGAEREALLRLLRLFADRVAFLHDIGDAGSQYHEEGEAADAIIELVTTEVDVWDMRVAFGDEQAVDPEVVCGGSLIAVLTAAGFVVETVPGPDGPKGE